MNRSSVNKLLIALVFLVIGFSVASFGPIAKSLKSADFSKVLNGKLKLGNNQIVEQKIVQEESVVTDVAEKVSPSVVTVSAQIPRRRVMTFGMGGFGSQVQGGQKQDIGTGFVISSDGLIVTNKHVVSESGITYKVITQDDKEYDVESISRDPLNDVAIIKIKADNLTPVTLGSSENLKVGQFVIAIGTALGEFRHTVTTGVVSGLGRGITAGSAYEGYVERLDNVIQTDAAINPGNSGGPLLNSAGQVIGVNVAVAQSAQNIGFSIPIDVVKKRIDEYKSNGSFAKKPFLGVQYQIITRQSAITNDVPQGAYVQEVVTGSPAEKSGIQTDDIITKIDGNDVKEDSKDVAEIISNKKVGDKVSIIIWRDGETKQLEATLVESPEN